MLSRESPRGSSTKLPAQDLREVPKWAARYAQSRVMSFVVFQVVFILVFLAIGGLAAGAGAAWRAGRPALLWSCVGALVPVCIALIVFSVPRWGGRLSQWVTRKFYAAEGCATPVEPLERRAKTRLPWMVWIFVILLAGGIPLEVSLGFLGYIPQRYMQPVSAIYFVPAQILLFLAMRPAATVIFFLWPVLYTVHALLILAGAPILFTGLWDSLNVLLPRAGYGLLMGLAGHFYNRLALRRLRTLTRLAEPDAPAATED